MSESDDRLENAPSKMPPETAHVQNRAQPRRLRKNVVFGIIAVLSGVLLLALVFGITQNPLASDSGESLMPAIASQDNVPGFVKLGPQSYADVPVPVLAPEPQPVLEPTVTLGPAMQGDLAAAGIQAPQDSPFETLSNDPRQLTEEERLLAQEWRAVLDGPVELQVNIDMGEDNSGEDRGAQRELTPAERQQQLTEQLISGLGGTRNSLVPGQTADYDPTSALDHQANKRVFLANAPAGDNDFYVSSRVQAPLSPFEIKSGSVIPCTLITGIDSDLPGGITCHVRQNVFDTVSGNYLLVPQGTRVIGEYDSQVVFGQSRVLVVWHRLIMPNGNSLDLEGMPGVDLSGYSGYADKVNNHWGRLAAAVVLSSVFAAAPVAAVGDDTGFNRSVESEVARNIGSNTKDAGTQIVERELNIQPTITIKPGFAINIFVQKDLILSPYQAHTIHEIRIDPAAN